MFPLFPICQNRVRIAVLDTGIDMTNDFIRTNRARIKGKTSFLSAPEDSCKDLDGHGTHVAGLLLKVAHNAEIYPARVTKGREIESAECIAKVRTFAHTL